MSKSPATKAKLAKANKGGRPAKITASVVEEVCEHMALGVPEEYACALVGVNPATFGPAVCRNPEFKAIKLRHDAKFMSDSLRVIKEGGERVTVETTEGPSEKVLPWTGRAWILERRYKPHFNKSEVVKPTEGENEKGGLMTTAEMADLEKMTKALVREMDANGSLVKRRK